MNTTESQYRVKIGDAEYGPAPMAVLVRWAEEGRITAQAVVTPEGGGGARPASAVPELAAIVAAPPTRFTGMPAAPGAPSGVEVLIPYRNSPALIGYYVSIASLIPLVGNIAGPIAVVLGVLGLKKRKREPEVRGAAHAWVAIILGGLMTLLYNGLIVLAIVGSAM